MSKKIEDRIRNAFDSEKPDILSKIKDTCENIAPESALPKIVNRKNNIAKRILIYAACIAVVAALTVGVFYVADDDFKHSSTSESDASYVSEGASSVSGSETSVSVEADSSSPEALAETYIYIDVNPSIELRLDADDNVISCLPVNKDAERVIAVLTDIYGVNVDDALNEIMHAMLISGYLSADSNSVLVSIDTVNGEDRTELLEHVTEKINESFDDTEMDCAIISQSVEADDELKQRARDHGVSVGKMHLVDKLVENVDGFSRDNVGELTKMPIKDLNLIYSTHPPKENGKPFDKDIIVGDVGGFVPKEEVLSALLNATGLAKENIEFYDIKAKPLLNGQERQMIYLASIKLIGDGQRYEFEVDCETGEVLKLDAKLPPKDIPKNDPPKDDENMPKPPQENGNEPPPRYDDPNGEDHKTEPPHEQHPDFSH